MELMPEETVMDYGDINPVDIFNSLNFNKEHNQIMYQGQTIRPMNAGILHEYVQLYYLLGNTKKADALGMKLLDNYNSVIAYFEHSSVENAADTDNAEDLIAVVDALLKMRTAVMNKNGKLPQTQFARELERTVQRVYKKVLPSIYTALDQAAAENGEMSDSYGNAGPYGTMLVNLKSYMGALAEHHGLIKAPVVASTPALPSEQNLDVNALTPGAATGSGMNMQQ